MTDAPVIPLSIPNPFPEGRTQVYVIACDPVTLIDTGVATDRAFDALVQGLKDNGLAIADIKRVVLTHKHIDHLGNAWRVREHSGAEIFIHESELPAVRDVDPGGDKFAALVAESLDAWGVPHAQRPQVTQPFRWNLRSADATPLADGDLLPLELGTLEIIHTPGHSFGSVCVRLGDRLFTGDHVLPDISPNIGGGDLRRRGLLALYLHSLAKMLELPGQEPLAFPGHGRPFPGLRGRCEALWAHHRARLDEVAAILKRYGPLTPYEVARMLFGALRDFHVVLGCAEAASHLEYLLDQGRVVQENGRFRLA